MTTTTVGPVREAPTGRRRRLVIGPYFVFLLVVGATIPWQSKSYYQGGFDAIALAKAALSLFALGCAVLVAFGRPVRELRASPLIFLVFYLTCSVFGAWSTGELVPSMVIVVRVMLLATTVLVLSRAFDGPMMLGSLVAALGTFALVGAATGISSLAEGRLRGGLPPLHPNELGSTCAVVVLWCLWKILAGLDNWLQLGILVMALAVMIATASRTPWIAMGVAALILVLHTQAIRVRTIVLAVAALPVVWWAIAGTDLIQDLLFREDEASSLTTLSNRTIAWEAALAPKSSPWVTWFGGGLQLKRINVAGQYWNQQILDSSWISALVQAGFVGLVLCTLWVLASMVSTVHSSARLRALQLALLIYLTLRGFLESGLFDASTAFLLFFTTVMATPFPSTSPPHGGPSSESLPAQGTPVAVRSGSI